jgi:type IV secretion system protein VirD4
MIDKDKRMPAVGLALIGALLLKFADDQHHASLAVIKLMWIFGATGLGFALGWLFSPQGRYARQVALYVAAGLMVLVAIFNNGALGVSSTGFLSFVGFIAALAFWLAANLRGFMAKPTSHGSAEWADLAYLQANKLTGAGGLRLGTFPSDKGDVPVTYDGDRHMLTVAPTGSGKGTTLIVPNLLAYPGSAIVIDPKGENAMITAGERARMGQTIHVVDPWLITSEAGFTPSRFNPLDWLVLGDPDITENAMLLADALIVADGQGDRFWAEEAKALLSGLILYVATDEREAGMRHLARVRDLLLLDGEEMPALFQRMAESVHHVVAGTGARSLQKEDKLLANVVASAQAQTHFLDSPRIRESLSASDFAFEDLKTQKMTIYLVLPADRLVAFGRWLRLLIQQAITVNARNLAVRPPHPILFLLDEMAALGKLAMVEQAYGLMRGFGIQLWGVAQDLSQLKRDYGDGWETFISNAGAIQYFGSRDPMTATQFSTMCGVTTIWTLSSAIARAFSKDGGSTTLSDTHAPAQRKLIFPDELMRLPHDRQLLLIENHHPILAKRTRWFNDATLRLKGRNLHAIEGRVS